MSFISKLKTRKVPNAERNFGLTEKDFNEMVVNMRQGDEKLFEQIFLSHFSSCMQFLKTNYKVDHSVAYDISMDTLMDFREGLTQNKYSYGNLRFLFTRMATQRLIKEKRKSSKLQLVDEFSDVEDENPVDFQEELNFVRQALAKLDPKKQHLLKQFYFNKLKLKEIASTENKSHCAIRKQKERSIIALKNNYLSISKPKINRLQNL